MSIPKEELYRLIDDLPSEKISKAKELLESLVKQNSDDPDPDVELIATDPEIIRQIKASREDRKQGRTYSEKEGLEVLRQEMQEYERESNV